MGISMNSSHNDVYKKVPSEPIKAFFSLAFLGVSWVANASSLALTHEYVPNYEPLPDIILDNIAYQSWALDVSEILLMISIIAAVVVVVFHKYRFILLRRIWFLLGLLYFYRSVTIFVTVLPKADSGYECSQKAGNITALLVINRVVTILSGGGLSINGKHIYCGDYIFSGHTVIFVMAYLCIKQYAVQVLPYSMAFSSYECLWNNLFDASQRSLYHRHPDCVCPHLLALDIISHHSQHSDVEIKAQGQSDERITMVAYFEMV